MTWLMNIKPLRLLFLCTGNSCRSIMAEAITNHYSNCRYQAFSAGSVPIGSVHPKAVETLVRHGIKPNMPLSQPINQLVAINSVTARCIINMAIPANTNASNV